jgi:hypothetical protein
VFKGFWPLHHSRALLEVESLVMSFIPDCIYVLGFLSCGDGSKEAAHILGLLGLPNDTTTMETRSFNIIEERISPTLQQIGEEVLLQTLT